MLFPDRHELTPDTETVLDAAAALDVTEFRVFELAYLDWYGRRASVRHLDCVFTAYMFEGRIPPWVRHYTRKIMALRQRGALDPQALGLEPARRTRAMLAKGWAFVLALLAVLALLLIAADLTGHLFPFVKECYFPPCY